MEYICYILAALGAGIGTGLAGLSATTVMVPILIVLGLVTGAVLTILGAVMLIINFPAASCGVFAPASLSLFAAELRGIKP